MTIWKIEDAMPELTNAIRNAHWTEKTLVKDFDALVLYDDVDLAKEVAKLYKGVKGVSKVSRRGTHITVSVHRSALDA